MREPETREQQAAREVGHTELRPAVARALSGALLASLLLVAAAELVRDATGPAGSPWAALRDAPGRAWQALRADGPVAANRRLLADVEAFEDAIEERSAVAARVLPPVQQWLTARLGAGSEQVVVGRRGWLFFRPALDYLTGPGFLEPEPRRRRRAAGHDEPLGVIADFGAQLAERGVGLVVVVTPVKAALHPEALVPELADAELPLENPSLAAFLAALEELEIPAWSPAAWLAAAKRERSWPQFLSGDTHWTPQAMEDTARGLAELLARHVPLPEREPLELTHGQAWVEGRGDLVALLQLPASQRLFPPQRVPTRPVRRPDGSRWEPDPEADVLVLGDSFTNVFSQMELGWGEGAGFAEQLALFMRRPVDRLAVNAGGASASRELLASRPERLAGKRLVVYQLTARELSAGDWRRVALPPLQPTSPSPRRPEQPLPARGRLAWESKRSGEWRIWTRRLEGSSARQLSPDEPGRQHCCAHLSPDGSRLVYLSRAVPGDEYPELEVAGELRLVELDSGRARTLRADARPYGWGNRAALWHDERHLAWIDAEGRSFRIDVDSGVSTPLSLEPRRRLAWLVDATLSHAVDGSPSFSRYDAGARRVLEGARRAGCEPYFSHDGRFGFWVRGGGGPFQWLDLRSGETGTLLRHEDTRIPGAQRYAYFPMLSQDGRLLVFGASAGDHDHFRSNYDLFAAPVDPASLALVGRPLRLTAHPASDRYPDVHVEALDAAAWSRAAPPLALVTPAAMAAPVAPFEANATLRSCSRVPSLREISPYRAALIVCEWQVTELLGGAAPGPRVRVAHWALRDGVRQSVASWAPGTSARLRVEPLDGVSQIEGYPLFDTLAAAPELAVQYAREP